jgi:hypothetical protein
VRTTAWRGIVWASPYVWSATKVVATDTATVLRAAAATQTARTVGSAAGSVLALAAGAALGYAIGAVVGTIIISKAEKEGVVYEGATADVLDFYMGKGHYWDQGAEPTPGYFNIPGNIGFITEHYKREREWAAL